MNFSLGADPEIFVAEGDNVRSIIGKIGGTKEMPLPLPIGDGFCVQEDNVAMEFNIPASHTKDEFISNIVKATTFLENVVKHQYNFNFYKQSAVSFPEEELQDPASQVFGCDPDFDAWTGKTNPRPKAKDKNLRSCGGHVHIGVKTDKPLEIIKACDLFLGVPSVVMDKGELRKKLYGKRGAFRIKPYGVEYRTLSNWWIFDEKLIGWVWDSTARALDAVSNNYEFESDANLILQAINKNNKDAAKELIAKHNLLVV